MNFVLSDHRISDKLKDMFLKNNDETNHIIKKGIMSISTIIKHEMVMDVDVQMV
jgi:hypothetical protein